MAPSNRYQYADADIASFIGINPSEITPPPPQPPPVPAPVHERTPRQRRSGLTARPRVDPPAPGDRRRSGRSIAGDRPVGSMADILERTGMIQQADERSVMDPRAHAGHFMAGLASGGAGVIGGVGGAMSAADAAVGDDPTDEGLGAIGKQLTEYGSRVSTAVAPGVAIISRAMEDPREIANPRFWSSGAGMAVGSMLALAPVAAGGMKAAALAGLGVGASTVVGTALAGIFESVVEGGSAYDEAIAEGKSDVEAAERAAKVAAANVGLNVATNTIGFGPVLRGLMKGKKATTAASRMVDSVIGAKPTSVVATTARGALVEAAQEASQEGIQNVAAGRPVGEGALVSGAIGAMGGATVAGGLAAAQRSPPPPPTMPPPDVTPAPTAIAPAADPVAAPAPAEDVLEPPAPEPTPAPAPAPAPVEVGQDETLEDADDTAKAPDLEHPPPLATVEDEEAAKAAVVREEVGQTGDAIDFDPDELVVDAARFQFKAAGENTSGETGRLADVETWNPLSSGMAVVWIDKGGTQYIVDGHQRLGLAKRMKAKGQTPKITARILRETDGITSDDARAAAAIKNINEGSGTAVDAARVFRQSPEGMAESGLSGRSKIVRQGQAMAALDDRILRMVEKGDLSAEGATAAAAETDDVDMQWRIAKEFVENPPANENEARSIARQILGFVVDDKATQETLFGKVEVTQDIYRERGQVMAKALGILKSDKRVASTLLKNKSVIDAVGNTLDDAANKKWQEQAAVVTDLVEKLSLSKGQVSDALTAAALKVKDGTPVATAAKAFNTAIASAMEEGGLAGLTASRREQTSESPPGFFEEGQGEDVHPDAGGVAPAENWDAEPDFSPTAPPSGPGLFAAGPGPDPVVKATPQPKPTSTPKAQPRQVAVAALPAQLRSATPRSGYRSANYEIAFASDTDLALYVTAQTKKSKRDAGYRDFLKAQGLSAAQITAAGARVKNRIKGLASARFGTGQMSGTLTVPREGAAHEIMARPKSRSGLMVSNTPRPFKKVKVPAKTLSETLALPTNIQRSSGTAPLDTPATPPPTDPAAPASEDLRPMAIVQRVAESMKVPIHYGKAAPGALGHFRTVVNSIRLAVRGDAETSLHELGHAVDRIIGHWSDAQPAGGPLLEGQVKVDYVDELAAMGQETSRQSYTAVQVRREGVAEFVRTWLVDAETARTAAPKFAQAFENWIASGHPTARALTQAQEELSAYHRLTPDRQGEVQMAGGREPSRSIRKSLQRFFWGPGEAVETATTRLNQSLNDQYYILRKADDFIGTEDPALGLAAIFHSLGGTAGIADTYIRHGIRTADGTKVGDGLMGALAELKTEGEQQRFRKFLVARRSARVHEHGLMSGLADTTIAEWQTYGGDPAIARATEKYDRFRSDLLDYAIRKGVLTEDMRAKWEARWGGAYAPLKRVAEAMIDPTTGKRAGGGASWRNTTAVGRKFFGGKETILDPIVSTIEDTFEFVKKAETNAAMRELVERIHHIEGSGQWLEEIPPDQSVSQVKASEVKDAYRQALENQGLNNDQIAAILADETLDQQFDIYRPNTQASGPNRQLTYLARDGSRKWFNVNNEMLFETLSLLGPRSAHTVISALRPFASLARSTATLNLPFVARAVIKDVTQVNIYSERGLTPAAWLRGVRSVVTQDEDFQLYLASGAAQSNYIAQDIDYVKRAMQDTEPNKIKRRLVTLTNPFELLNAAREIAELTTRVAAGAHHRQAWKAEGQVQDEAMMKRLGYGMRNWTQNFQKQGTGLERMESGLDVPHQSRRRLDPGRRNNVKRHPKRRRCGTYGSADSRSRPRCG